MNYLLDTHACVDVLKGHPAVTARLAATRPADCAISTITAFELLNGVLRCGYPDREKKKLERLFSMITVLPFDAPSASEAARVRNELEKGGQKSGPYDVLIAGQALGADLAMVTHNTREFSRVRSLRLVDWRD